MVVDESHYLKSADSKRTKALMPLIKDASRVLLLSGTPALSRPIELFTQLHSMLPDTFRTATAFGKRYCNGFQGAYGWDFTGSSNLEELHWLMAETVMIRRLKKDVLKELPPKLRQQIFLEPTAQCKKEFVGLKKQQSQLDSKIRGSSGTTRQTLENAKRNLTVKMYQETGKAKIVAALAYLDELSAKGVKALLFAHHRDVLDAMMLHLAKRKLKSIRIDGETPQQTRQTLCTQFQTDVATRFAVLSITAAGVGLTLHAAQTVVFFELFWNPGQLLQAEDRAHRLGQQKVVDVKYLICKGTADDTIWALIDQKLQVVGSAVSGTKDKLALVAENGGAEGDANGEGADPIEEYMAAVAAAATAAAAGSGSGGRGSGGSSGGSGGGGVHSMTAGLAFNPPDFEDDDGTGLIHNAKRRKTAPPRAIALGTSRKDVHIVSTTAPAPCGGRREGSDGSPAFAEISAPAVDHDSVAAGGGASASAGASAGDGGSGGGTWACSACTFVNANTKGLACSICGAERQQTSTTVPSHTALDGANSANREASKNGGSARVHPRNIPITPTTISCPTCGDVVGVAIFKDHSTRCLEEILASF